MDSQREKFFSTFCYGKKIPNTIDKSLPYFSSCNKWSGELDLPGNIMKISLICIKLHQNIKVKVLVGIKGKKLRSCRVKKGTKRYLHQFDCHGKASDTIAIRGCWTIFDVKVVGTFKYLLFIFSVTY